MLGVVANWYTFRLNDTSSSQQLHAIYYMIWVRSRPNMIQSLKVMSAQSTHICLSVTQEACLPEHAPGVESQDRKDFELEDQSSILTSQ